MSTRIVQHAFGGPEVLDVDHDDAPGAPGPDEVLVRVAFAGVNPVDAMNRAGGAFAAAGFVTLPFVPGADLSGTVEAVGDGVRDLRVGDRVFGMARFPYPGSAYAQHAVVPAVDLSITPEDLSDEQAAALPMAAMTAWQALTDTARVEKGQRVLIVGAGGGVGHLAVQVARHLGAEVVAVAGADKHAWLRELGADVVIDHRTPGAVEALAADPVDLAYNLAPGPLDAVAAAVRPGGTLITVAGGAEEVRGAAEVRGVRVAATAVHTERAWLEAVTRLAADGELTPTVTRVFDLAAAADAHRALAEGHTRGKIVLRATPSPAGT